MTTIWAYLARPTPASARQRGELIAILEHDDTWLPEKLARQIPLFSDPSVGLVYCSLFMVDELGQIKSRWIARKRGDVYRDFLYKIHICTCSSVMIRRTCFDQVGLFDETLHGSQDDDMWIRIAGCYRVDYVPDCLVCFADYRVPSRIMNRPSLMIEQRRRHMAKFPTYRHDSALLRRRVLAYRHYTMANLVGDYGPLSDARHLYWSSIAMWPFNPKCWMALAASLLGARAFRQTSLIKSRLWRLVTTYSRLSTTE